jgi:hypothetical protein
MRERETEKEREIERKREERERGMQQCKRAFKNKLDSGSRRG